MKTKMCQWDKVNIDYELFETLVLKDWSFSQILFFLFFKQYYKLVGSG